MKKKKLTKEEQAYSDAWNVLTMKKFKCLRKVMKDKDNWMFLFTGKLKKKKSKVCKRRKTNQQSLSI